MFGGFLKHATISLTPHVGHVGIIIHHVVKAKIQGNFEKRKNCVKEVRMYVHTCLLDFLFFFFFAPNNCLVWHGIYRKKKICKWYICVYIRISECNININTLLAQLRHVDN